MIKFVSFLFRHFVYNLRGGFLVRPLAISVVLGTCGLIFSQLEAAVPELTNWIPLALFPSHQDPQVAQVILGSIATSVMTVVSIVFSILLMTLTLASMQYSPRILIGFTRDKGTQWTLGVFLGTFAYCIAALPVARSMPKPFAPVGTVLGAMTLAFLCVAWLLYFIHHISQAISVNHIVDRIASETEAAIDQLMPNPIQPRIGTTQQAEAPGEEERVVSTMSGYVRFLDVPRLVAIATDQKLTIRVTRRIGHFVPAGGALLACSGRHSVTPEATALLRGVFDIGPTRTLEQDIEFGVLQIVDIALKAISPAVNDPSTAISCVDHLGRLLIRIAGREPPESDFFHPPGTLRVSVPWLTFERFLDSAFEQIRAYSKGDLAVSLRMMRSLMDISGTVDDVGQAKMLAERGRRIVAGCMETMLEEETVELRARQAELDSRVSGLICSGARSESRTGASRPES
ncbi:MAG TPA: DUF2254 domain-containing protein [Fimbriimonadaceae bacterium]|nr:DUF2254 domain-containing protein [Fimbriimonadaceae bacterium]